MTCFFPLVAQRTSDGSVKVYPHSKVSFFSSSVPGVSFFVGSYRPFAFIYDSSTMYLPCGKCLGCRVRYSSDWSCRVLSELVFHRESCFLTLTYDDAHLPSNRSLDKSHYQNFLKRLRITLFRAGFKSRIKYICSGEYGSRTFRPHYHLLLFGFCPKDLVPFKYKTNSKMPIYSSAFLDKLWGKGWIAIGTVTSASADYVSKYILKKRSSSFYSSVIPEFMHASTRYGIGHSFFNLYWSDFYKSNTSFVLHGTRRFPVPRYFDRLLKKYHPESFAAVLASRLIYIRSQVSLCVSELYERLYNRFLYSVSKFSLYYFRSYDFST